MTHKFQQLRDQLIRINDRTLEMLNTARQLPGLDQASFDHWETVCHGIPDQTSGKVRIAVTGAIKSGKSTFVNSLFKGDYLKRGAGVVTSFITRIHPGSQLSANLTFKDIQTVNQEIQNALVLFPPVSENTHLHPFDIRSESLRKALLAEIEQLHPSVLYSSRSRDRNSMVLESFVTGYDEMKEIISESDPGQIFDQDQFHRHRDYVANDNLAVYLKDIVLTIPSDILDETVEIADCQGSDAVNPLHLVMIQQYLMTAHMIIYVISSRTGIRQADIEFLSMIKKMGIIGNSLFVLNIDISEHESLEDLEILIEKVRKELALLASPMDLFCFSALKNLFTWSPDSLLPKDEIRLLSWQEEQAICGMSDQQTQSFLDTFQLRLSRQRDALLFSNPVERLKRMVFNLNQWADTSLSVAQGNMADMARVMAHFEQLQDQLDQLDHGLKSAVEGALINIRSQLDKQLHRFFDPHTGKQIMAIMEFIRTYSADTQHYEKVLETSPFTAVLYMAFHDFKQALDQFISHQVTPELIHFIKSLESSIEKDLKTVSQSFDTRYIDLLSQHGQLLNDLGVHLTHSNENPHLSDPPIIDMAKMEMNLEIPPFSVTLPNSIKITTQSVVRLKAQKLFRVIRQWFKPAPPNKITESTQALNFGLKRLKCQMEQHLLFFIKDYRENLKFQYLMKLAETSAMKLLEAISEHNRVSVSNIGNILHTLDENRIDRDNLITTLENLKAETDSLAQDITDLKQDLMDSSGPN